MSFRNRGFITVRKSFIVLLCIVAVSGYLGEFVILFALICLHESAHILTAKYFDAEIINVTVMPLGLSAGIKNFDFLSVPKKVVILVSGPLLNLFLAAAAFLLFGERALFFAGSNICIFVINVLPVMPLDGGNIFMAIFNNKIGVMPASDILVATGRVMSAAIMLTGIIQIVLYPYNASLLCLGFYLFMTTKDKNAIYQNIFVKIITFAEAKKDLKFMPVKQVAVIRDCPICDAIRHFGFNCYTEVHIISEDGILRTLTEGQILKCILEKGIDSTVCDAMYELI